MISRLWRVTVSTVCGPCPCFGAGGGSAGRLYCIGLGAGAGDRVAAGPGQAVARAGSDGAADPANPGDENAAGGPEGQAPLVQRDGHCDVCQRHDDHRSLRNWRSRSTPNRRGSPPGCEFILRNAGARRFRLYPAWTWPGCSVPLGLAEAAPEWRQRGRASGRLGHAIPRSAARRVRCWTRAD